MASVSQRLLERLDALILAWASATARGTDVLSTLSNVLEQRSIASQFHVEPPSIHEADGFHPIDAGISSLASAYSDAGGTKFLHAGVAPLFLEEFPDAIPRLIRRQAEAANESIQLLTDVLDELRGIVASMHTLARDAAAKSSSSAIAEAATAASTAPSVSSSQPASTPVFVAASWIDQVAAAYTRELFSKEDVIYCSININRPTHEMPIEKDKNVKPPEMTHKLIEAVRRQWDLANYLDLALELRIRDQLRLARLGL